MARDNRDNVTCSVFGKRGHIAQECYTVVFYPQKKGKGGGGKGSAGTSRKGKHAGSGCKGHSGGGAKSPGGECADVSKEER